MKNNEAQRWFWTRGKSLGFAQSTVQRDTSTIYLLDFTEVFL